jgi:DNA topoisomerase I
MGKKTIIVESPTKARTISRYLGREFTVVSTVGHIRDLPKSSLGVELEHGFEPQYQVIKGKAKTIKQIKDAVKDADEVYLAPDPDREGEAIAWHVAELIKRPVQRIELHEITKRAVLEALQHPRQIDYDRVNAQQARRVLDRLVGYQISPLMWRKIKPGLSAGRVQSVAVRLICEREEEIRSFTANEYWTFDASFDAGNGRVIEASLARLNGMRLAHPGEEQRREEEDGATPRTITSLEEAEALAADIRAQAYCAGNTALRAHSRRPQPPFTTSTMQQDAARKLGWTARRTMTVAQQLYEGVELAGGLEGLITYMRTDSVRVAPEAIIAVRDAIAQRYGPNYLPERPNTYTSKAMAQEAHEAVRPTDVLRDPESMAPFLSSDQLKLYRLIHFRFVASQVRPAEFETQSIEISGGPYLFRASVTSVKFLGFLAVYGDERAEDQQVAALPELPAGVPTPLLDVSSEQHFTKPSARFTDATLVKALEDNGIGRPSTYAPIIETILARGYVVRTARHFEPTEWGFVTTELMKHYFPDIVDIGFTREMEGMLDSVEEGREDWRQLLTRFYGPFKQRLDLAAGEKRYFKAKPLETDVVCEKCGSPMVLRHGKYGRFLSCSAYPKCSNIKNVDDKGNIIERPVSEAGQETGRDCPKCNGKLLVKASRWGTKFIGCGSYPKCDYTSELQTQCPKCGGELVKRRLPNRRSILVCQRNEDSKGEACDFVLWGKPLIEHCPLCNWFLAEQKIRGTDRWRRYCSNPGCPNHRGIGDDALADEAETVEAPAGGAAE